MIEIKGWFLKTERYHFANSKYYNMGYVWIDISNINTICYGNDYDKKVQFIEITLTNKDDYDYRIYDADLDILLLALKELNNR